MSLSLTTTPLALEDMVQLADHIATDSLDAAIRFLDAVEDTCQRLVEMPELGALCQFKRDSTKGIRVWAVRGFPNHLLFYQVEEDSLAIIRVLHGARDYGTLFRERIAGSRSGLQA